MPELYNETDALPEKMPAYLKDAIKDLSNPKEVYQKHILLKCDKAL